MIRVVHPVSGSWFFTHPLSRIQGWKGSGSRIQQSKRHLIPDLQQSLLPIIGTLLVFSEDEFVVKEEESGDSDTSEMSEADLEVL